MARYLLLILCLAILPSPACAAKRIALVVGINTYDNLGPDKQLQKAVNDARAVAAVMQQLGYSVTREENISRSQFNSSWQRFLYKIEPGDVVALYFSGHGIGFRGEGNYLLFRDIPGTPLGEVALKRESVGLYDLLEDLGQRRPAISLVILDACRDNPFNQLVSKLGRSLGRDLGLAPMEAPEGTFIMYAAGIGEKSLDRLSNGDPEPNSVYTRVLLPLLRTPGLTLPEIAVRTRARVRDLAMVINHKQTPAYYDQVVGSFCFAECNVEAPGKAEESAWAQAIRLSTLAGFKHYLKDFPTGAHAVEARSRIKELSDEDDAAWREAINDGTAAAFEAYLHRFADPVHAADAQERVLRLKGAEEAAWTQASRADTPRALKRYLQAFPDGAHAAHARRRLAILEAADETGWVAANSPATFENMKQYLQRFPEGAHTVEARQWLKTFAISNSKGAPARQTSSRTPNRGHVSAGCFTFRGSPYCPPR